MFLVKLTNRNGQTRNNTIWGPGVTHRATGESTELCSNGFIHAYEGSTLRRAALVAEFMNPEGANFKNPLFWEARGKVRVRDGQLKCGCRRLTTVRELRKPIFPIAAKVRAAVRLALLYGEPSPEFRRWAESWLSNEDRSASAARAAAAAASAYAAYAAATAATAARAAASAAYAAYATTAAYAAYAARAAAVDLGQLLENCIQEERRLHHAKAE